MTTYQDQGFTPNPHAAPVLDADRQRAGELWEQVKGTEMEAQYRAISSRHPRKADSRTAYLAFLDELEAMFVQPEVQNEAVTPEVVDADEASAQEDAPATEPAEVPAQVAETPTPSQEDEAQAEEEAEEDAEPGEGDEEDTDDEGEGETETKQETPALAKPEVVAENAAPKGLTDGGLFTQLFGMLHDGGEVSLQVMRVGEQLTVGIFPKPVPGETSPQSVVVTESAAWFDANLLSAMRPYTQARVDAFAAFQQAAKQQAAASKKPEKTAAKKPEKSTGPKLHALTLKAAEGSTISGKHNGKELPLTLGKNDVPAGTIEMTVKHDLFGEQKKSLLISAAREYDFTAQQGGHLTVKPTPEGAALSATKGETQIALHGETLLPAGKWTIHAEATHHLPKTVQVSVKAGDRQTVELALDEMNSLF